MYVTNKKLFSLYFTEFCLQIYLRRDYLDPVLSVVIVILICISSWPLLRDSTLGNIKDSTLGNIRDSTLDNIRDSWS